MAVLRERGRTIYGVGVTDSGGVLRGVAVGCRWGGAGFAPFFLRMVPQIFLLFVLLIVLPYLLSFLPFLKSSRNLLPSLDFPFPKPSLNLPFLKSCLPETFPTS